MFFAHKNCHEFRATAGIVAGVAFSRARIEDTAIKTVVKTKMSRHRGIRGNKKALGI